MDLGKDKKSPFMIYICADSRDNKGRTIQRKSVKYIYSSVDAYKTGELPVAIHVSGIAGREGADGMYRRLPSGKYIDNSTFTKNGSGEGYSFEECDFEEIVSLIETNKMQATLSSETKKILKNGFRIPDYIRAIVQKAQENEIEIAGQEQRE